MTATFDREAIRLARSEIERHKEQSILWPVHDAYAEFLRFHDALVEAVKDARGYLEHQTHTHASLLSTLKEEGE